MDNKEIVMECFVHMDKDGCGLKYYNKWKEYVLLFDPFSSIGDENRKLLEFSEDDMSHLKHLEFYVPKRKMFEFSLS